MSVKLLALAAVMMVSWIGWGQAKKPTSYDDKLQSIRQDTSLSVAYVVCNEHPNGSVWIYSENKTFQVPCSDPKLKKLLQGDNEGFVRRMVNVQTILETVK